MKSIFFAIGMAIVATVAAIAAGSAIWLFWDVLKGTDLDAFRSIVGAFAGAFFAYLFVRFGDALKKVYDRKETNHTALVKLQHYFNDCLNTTGDNVFIVKNCVDCFTDERLTSAEVPIYMNNFQQYFINRDVVTQLTNVDFLNEVYSLNMSLHKMNDSLATIDRSYSQLRESYLAKNIDVGTYKTNAQKYRNRCVEINSFLLQTKDDLTRLFAVANLLLQDPPFLVRIIRALVRTTYPKNFSIRLQVEKERVTTEIDAFAKASAEKIRATQRK
ncbi:MAG: hypothetical protein Q7S51_09135 [Gallionellaceae bacterium]|nr:hypothetical protein [Gallionellaceae bacterium]